MRYGEGMTATLLCQREARLYHSHGPFLQADLKKKDTQAIQTSGIRAFAEDAVQSL